MTALQSLYHWLNLYQKHSSMTVCRSRHESVVWSVVLWGD